MGDDKGKREIHAATQVPVYVLPVLLTEYLNVGKMQVSCICIKLE